MKTVLLILLAITTFFSFSYCVPLQIGLKQGKKQTIKDIGGLGVYNSLSKPIWVDTIWTKNTIHFDTIQTYVVTCGKYNGEETLYYVDLPDGYAYDAITKEELDSVLMGFNLKQ